MGSGGTKKTLENTTKSDKWSTQRTQNQQKMLHFSQKQARRPRGRNSASHSGFTVIPKKTRSHARREAQKRFASGPHGSDNSAEKYLKLDCRRDFLTRAKNSYRIRLIRHICERILEFTRKTCMLHSRTKNTTEQDRKQRKRWGDLRKAPKTLEFTREFSTFRPRAVPWAAEARKKH